MVLRDQKDPLNTSRGIMGPLENSAGVQNNRGRLKQRFDLIRKLGQGTYGKVQLGIDKETGQEVAIKTIKKSKIETEADLIRIRREIQIMSSVRHPNIIHIYEVFENREKMVLVMEYAAGGELYDYLNERKILQEDEARRIFRQIASAVYYCHKNKICHRDLKLENILLDEKSNAKIADFGLSNVFDDVNMLKTFCGSPLYASPEIVKGTPYSGPEVDCWSLGVLLYTLVYGAMPFDGSNFKRLVKQISAGDYYEPKKPAEASPLIRIMLTVDPKKRAKVEDICAHVWINHGFDKDCLHSAEELAKQTPVRLDVLLTLAPNMNNHAGASSEAGAGESNHKKLNESDSAVGEPPKKAKMQGGDATGQKDGVSVPQKPKRKTQSKTKSKTTPLMLDLIQDVVEEENEDVDMSATQPQAVVQKMAQAQPVAGTSSATKGKPTDDKDDDECDTLSEISEIQTIAEDLDNVSKKKERVKSVKGKAAAATAAEKQKVPPPPEEHESRPKQAKQTATTNSQPPVSTPKLQKTETPEVKKPVPEVTSPEEVTPTPKPAVVKKKIVPKPKATSPAPKPTTTTTTQETKVTPETKPVVPPSEPPTPPKTVTPPEVAQPEVKPVPPPTAASDKDKTPEATDSKEKKPTLVRQRSGSVSDVSPTRVERRNSKIISQKTAELIQNLETKTSSTGSGRDSGSSSGGEGSGTGSSKPHPTVKKLVIPNFKVSDAKNKFETKPPRPITSSIMSQSKAAFEAKAAASQSTPVSPPVKPTPPTMEKAKEKVATIPAATVASKAKSPSPVPKDDKQLVAPPEPKEQVSPKMKPKVVKKPENSPKVPTSPVAKSITPEPPTISEATVTTVAPTAPVTEPESEKIVEKVKPKPPGKIQIPPGLQTKPAAVVNKVAPPPTAPVSVPSVSKVTSPSPSSPPQSKEQAAKKISSVINKIVTSSSSSGDEANKKLIHKTEVTFPVVAAASAERVIPIKFEPEAEPETPSVASTKNRFPPRFDSFKRFDSASSIYSRQNSSDTDASCSLAPPKPEPIRKSPREFLIPIKLEASGVTVTPREDIGVQSDTALGGAGSEDEFRIDGRLRSGRFGSGHNKFKRYSSLLSDSSGVEEDATTSATGSRRGSGAVGNNNGASAATVAHARSRSQGDEPDATGGGTQQSQPAATFKRYRAKRPDLDRSDSFSSAEEDDEDFFEVFTADSLFSNLLDRVRNLTKRINREGSMGSMGPNWPSAIGGDATNFGLWNPSSSLRDLMQRAPSETRSFGSTTPGGFTVSTHRSFSRDPSLTMNLTSTGSGSNWRRSLSRDVSGDSDMSSSSFGGNNAGRSYAGSSCSSKAGLPTELFETTSVRSLPVTLNRRSPSYLSQRSEPYGSDRESVTPTPQRPYGRTMSSTDYGSNSPNLSRTLPFRRSLKSFNSQDHDYSVDSVVGAIRGLGQSLIDSPATFDPDSYLRQMRSDRAKSVGRELVVNREQIQNGNGRDCNSMARMTSISETEGGSGVTRGEAVETPPTDHHPGRLSVQDKMNNYTQYYNSLTGASPVKRFPSQIHAENGRGTSPSQNAIGLARLRPSTMFETVNGSSSSSSAPVGINNVAMTTSSSAGMNGSENATTKLTTGIPKWPGVSIQQYRPLSISSFPSENIGGKQITGRASSVSRVVSPPPPPQTATTATTPNMNKKDISRATSVERITRFLERKSSVPREVQPVEVGQTQNRPFSPPLPVSSSSPVPESRSSPTVRNTANNKSKFLQSLEKKWDKFTGNGQQQQPEMDKTRPMSPTILSGHRSPPPQQFDDEGERGELSSTEISPDDNKISESVLLRRALSPEKKVKKFGSGTVGFMLGKFKRFEEVTPPPPAANKFQIPAAGNSKPPVGSGSVGSRIGRRIQSAYAGAASDSVLTLSQRSNVTNFGNKSGILVNKGAEVGQDGGGNESSDSMQQPDPEIIRSGEAAQEKRRSLRPQVNNRALSPEMINPVVSRPLSPEVNSPSSRPLSPPEFKPVNNRPLSPEVNYPNNRPLSPPEFRPANNRPLSPEVNYPSSRPLSPPEFRPVNNRPLSPDPANHTYRPISPELLNNRPLSPEVTASTTRPLSLFVTTTIYNTDPIHSTPTLSSSSQIPRPNGLITTTLRSSSPIPTTLVKGQTRDLGLISPEPIPHPEREVITSKSMTSPPHVTINRSPSDNLLLSPSMISPNSDSVTTTTGDLDDSGSICSSSDVRNILEDAEESVSDRIFRKSFYPRFHEKGIKTRSVSLNAASAARKGLHPNPQITNTPAPISNGHHHHHHHHHHRSSSQAKSVTPAGGKAATPSTSTPAAETSPTITTTTTNGPAMSTLSTMTDNNTTRAPSPHSLVINKYNPNPLFKELITDDFKSDIEKKTEYSRRVTSKLSKLLREIETDLNTCSLTKKDDDDEGDDEDEIFGGTKNMATNGVATTNTAPVENGTMDAKKPPVIGVGLKALAPTPPKNQNFKKYAGSKTTNLGGSINAVTNTTAKRNFFNREGSLQPEGEVTTKPMGFALLKPRASSVSRPMLNNNNNTTGNRPSSSCNTRDNSDADNDRMDR